MAANENNLFAWIEQTAQNGPDTAFAELFDRLRREKQYRLLFDARLMKRRLELGLPLVSHITLAELPKHLQQPYQEGYVEAAREVGELMLADGHIAHAWPYLRASGKTDSMIAALERFNAPAVDTPESQELVNAAIQIAFQEGLHPKKGFELILQHYGMCRAITMFDAYPDREGRAESLGLLVRSLHGELVTNVKRAIAAVEGQSPDTNSIPLLIAGRDWLFENNTQHTDSSHIVSVLRLACDLEDRETLKLAVEIADYATHLGPMFQYEEDPPFNRAYEDRAVYLRALLGEDVDRAARHFEEKAERFDPQEYGTRSGEVLVNLQLRLGRLADAIKAYQQYVHGAEAQELSCPSLVELCQMAGDFERLKQLAQAQADPLSYMAAVLQQRKDARE
jgi:hypothetical protein